LLLTGGPATVADLGAAIGVSTAAIRRHLDAMLADGDVCAQPGPATRTGATPARPESERTARARAQRGRGRPARLFALTDVGRQGCATHTYDDLATAALRWIARDGGDAAVSAFAAHVVSGLEERCRAATGEAGDNPLARAEALAVALSSEGYAASATAIASGGQLCQHHCPVAHVAAEFPHLCEAETAVISRLVGTHVQRLATIANGDGVCTTHIPDPRRAAAVQRSSSSTRLTERVPR
jgi:predicted ArsR family transcriptional regulator